MSELGNLLKERREELNKTKAAVSADTKIREAFLTMIEEGNFKELPSYLHAYGFVKKYAEYLGFSYDEVKGIFNQECPKEPQNSECGETEEKAKSKNSSGTGKIVTLIAGIALVVLIVWFMYDKFINKDDKVVTQVEPVPVLQDIVKDEVEPITADPILPEEVATGVTGAEKPVTQEPILAAPTTTPTNEGATPPFGIRNDNNTTTQIPAVTEQTQTTTIPQTQRRGDEDISVKSILLSFSDDCWVKFVSDNGGIEDFLAVAGTTKRLHFINSFTIDIGNAAALSMSFGTQNFRNFGGAGIALLGLKYSVNNGVLSHNRNR